MMCEYLFDCSDAKNLQNTKTSSDHDHSHAHSDSNDEGHNKANIDQSLVWNLEQNIEKKMK